MQGVNIDRLVKAYRSIGDARTTARRAHEEADELLEEQQKQVKVILLQMLNATGAKSVATESGTVYRTEKIKPSAADWTTVYDWINEDTERFELLEKRLKSTFVKQYMDENEGATPPGVNVHREYEVAVRRPNTASPEA